MGVRLWGERSLYENLRVFILMDAITSSGRRQEPAPDLIRGTETAYKAQSPGELAQHNEARRFRG